MSTCKIPNFQFNGLKLNEIPTDLEITFKKDCSMQIDDGNNGAIINQSGEITIITNYLKPKKETQDDKLLIKEENSLLCGPEYPYEVTWGLKQDYVLKNILNENVDLSKFPYISRDINNNQYQITEGNNTQIFRIQTKYPDHYTHTKCFKPNNCPSNQIAENASAYNKYVSIDYPICVGELEPGEDCDKNSNLYESSIKPKDPNEKTKCIYSAEYIQI